MNKNKETNKLEIYRLIKKYSGFPYPIGTEVYFNEKLEHWVDNHKNRTFEEDLECNKYPQFWELVKQDNFKLLLEKNKVSLNDIIPYLDPKNKGQIRLNNLAKLQYIEEDYRDNWKIDWNNRNQYKYYPYFIKDNGVWRVASFSYFGFYDSDGSLAYYETREKALDAGKKYLDTYISIIDPK